MNILANNTFNEFYKLLNKKKYLVLLIIGMCVCVGNVGISALISKISGGVVVVKGNIPLIMLRFTAEILVPLVVFMAVTDLFCSEIQEDTMKFVLLKPITRYKVLMSKTLAVFLVACIYFGAIFITCTILQIISGTQNLSGFFNALGAYVIDIIPVLAIILMAVLINLLSKSSTLAMLLCIAVYAIMKYANYYVATIGQMLFTSFSQWHRLWLGMNLPIRALIPKIGILFGSILILYTVSYIIFDKKEF